MTGLPEQAIHLWFASDERIKDESLLAEYRRWLSQDERARYQRFSCARMRHQYLVARALVRSVLSRYVPELEPAAWAFAKNEYGKPEIMNSDQGSQFTCR